MTIADKKVPPNPEQGKGKRKQRRVKVGDWICTFGKVTGLHGKHQLVVQIGPHECTLLRAEVWNPEDEDIANGK